MERKQEEIPFTLDDVGRRHWDLSKVQVRPQVIEQTQQNQQISEEFIPLSNDLQQQKIKEEQDFWCDKCEEEFKDSLSWYDHLNSKKHNQMCGMHMGVQKITVEDVKKRLDFHRNALLQKKQKIK